MPEHISFSASSHAFNKHIGSHYTPPLDETKDGVTYAHAVQTILVEPQALYDLWHDVETAPLWQEHVVSVVAKTETVSHWVFGDPEDPNGKRVEWDSEIIEDVRGQKIAWKSITDGVDESGTVAFAAHPSGRGTIVTLEERVKLPGGVIANAAAAVLTRSPRQTVIEDLRHFKELAEAGEIPSVKGQPHGPRGITGKVREWMLGETNPTPPGTSEQSA